LDWLADEQNGDGSWGTFYRVGRTGLALVAFCDYAVRQGTNPFSGGYAYSAEVEAGFDYLFSQAETQAIAAQTYGNPDSDGDGLGIYFYDHASDPTGSHRCYETGVALMAISSSDAPNRVVDVPASVVDGLTYEHVADDTVDFFAWGQNDSGTGRGAWYYSPGAGGGVTTGDQSVSGFASLGLGYAAADPPYGFGIDTPDFVLDELDIWIDYIQNDVDGDDDDGGSGYTSPAGWVNVYKTGHLLWQMELVGDSSSTGRVQDAFDYLERHWDDDDTDPGWPGAGGGAVAN
jgi:hypothetical protein